MAIAVSIVEDDPQARKILAGWINRAAGFRLAGEWGDAESALKNLPQKEPNVVLMDINLPGMSGVEAVKRLKPELPATQFVRSEEHTSELQSLRHLVCRLLLE